MALIQVSHLRFAYDGGTEFVFDDVSFELDTSWRLGFTGRNGRGKTTFLHLLMGEYEYSGTIAPQVACDYFPFPVAEDGLCASHGVCRGKVRCWAWRNRRLSGPLAA